MIMINMIYDSGSEDDNDDYNHDDDDQSFQESFMFYTIVASKHSSIYGYCQLKLRTVLSWYCKLQTLKVKLRYLNWINIL